MNIDYLLRLLLFGSLLLAQSRALNHIHLFDCATPLLYVYFVLTFSRGYPRWGVLVWSFLMGLAVDVFSNTPGLAASSMTLVALLQPYALELFVQRDSAEDLKPGVRSLGVGKYLVYTLLLTLVYCLVFFTIETFNFFNWQQWALNVACSTLLTTLLMIVVDNMRETR